VTRGWATFFLVMMSIAVGYNTPHVSPSPWWSRVAALVLGLSAFAVGNRRP